MHVLGRRRAVVDCKRLLGKNSPEVPWGDAVKGLKNVGHQRLQVDNTV